MCLTVLRPERTSETSRWGGKRRPLTRQSLDFPLLLPVGRRLPFTVIASATRRETGRLERKPGVEHAAHTQGYLNLPRPMELISPCSDLMGTRCVYLVPGWGCGFTHKKFMRFERTHVSNHTAVTPRVHPQSGFWLNCQFSRLYWWHQPGSIPFHKYFLRSYCVPALNEMARLQI